MLEFSYTAVCQFIYIHCPYKLHYCNGKHIPDINIKGVDRIKTHDKPPCYYFKENMCQHNSHPRWLIQGREERAAGIEAVIL